ncbi:MAG: hypothetical protein NC131_05870 [Roseburia sp.]|nr:hypothetical protein [Roseburia sp.]
MIYNLLEKTTAAWSAVSGISAAVAALISLFAIIISWVLNRKRINLDFITQPDSAGLLRVKNYFIKYFYICETSANGSEKYLKLFQLRRLIEFEFVLDFIPVGDLDIDGENLIRKETPILKLIKKLKFNFKKEKTNHGSDKKNLSIFRIAYDKKLRKYFVLFKNSLNKWVLLEKQIIDDMITFERICQSSLNSNEEKNLEVLEEYYKLFYFLKSENILLIVKHLQVKKTKKKIEKFCLHIENELRKYDTYKDS